MAPQDFTETMQSSYLVMLLFSAMRSLFILAVVLITFDKPLPGSGSYQNGARQRIGATETHNATGTSSNAERDALIKQEKLFDPVHGIGLDGKRRIHLRNVGPCKPNIHILLENRWPHGMARGLEFAACCGLLYWNRDVSQ
jgi:hypothetical protein